jgi:hypothetical protein
MFNAGVYVFLSSIYLNPDGVGYFSNLSALFYQHTLSFDALYDHFHLAMPLTVTATGWLANIWALGSAALWAPFLAAGRFYLSLQGAANPPAWSSLFMVMVNFASMLFGGSAMVLLYSALGMIQIQRRRLRLCLAAFLGTPLFFYSFLMGTVAHAATAFVTSLWIWFWLKTVQERRLGGPMPLRWFTLGLLGGVAAMVRTQEVLVLMPAVFEWGWRMRREGQDRRPLMASAGWLVLGTAFGFLPQALLWKFLYESFFHLPAAFNLSWRNFALDQCLFSSFHGLLIWTPLYALAFVGFIWRAFKRDRWAICLGSVLATQLLVNAFSLAWWEGLSFSLRQMTGTALLVGLGSAYLVQAVDAWRPSVARWGVMPLILACALWALLLALQNAAGALDTLLYVAPQALFKTALHVGRALSVFGHPKEAFDGDFWVLLIGLESLCIGWLALCLRKGSNHPWRKSCQVLAGTFTILVFYSAMVIVQSSRAPKPELMGRPAISEAQLPDFFTAETYEVLAIYHDQKGEKSLARDWFDRAARTLPVSPATEPWRRQIEQYRAQATAGTL